MSDGLDPMSRLGQILGQLLGVSDGLDPMSRLGQMFRVSEGLDWQLDVNVFLGVAISPWSDWWSVVCV